MRITAIEPVMIQAYVYFIKNVKKRDAKTFDLNVTAALQTFNMRKGEVREDVAGILAYSVISYKGLSQDGQPIETHSDFRRIKPGGEKWGIIDEVLLVEPWDYFQDRIP